MTGTDLCVNKCNQSRSFLSHLVQWHASTENSVKYVGSLYRGGFCKVGVKKGA